MPYRSSIIKTVLLGYLIITSFTIDAQKRNKKIKRIEYDFSAIDNKIRGWIDTGYYNGASLIVVKDNRVIHRQFYGNYNAQSVAYIASAGKWLAAATIAAVVDEGKLSWDDTVDKWLPEFKDSKGKATLRQLLSHIAGYPDYQPKGSHADNYQTLTESVAHIVGVPPDTLPGTKFKYGGEAMQVAGRMAELATGKDWETLFREKIANPLHMDSTHFTPVSKVGGQSPMLGGGARARLQDYANFLNMISNNGVFNGRRILSQKVIAAMQANQVGNAKVNANEFVERMRGDHRTSIYGLGEWREEVDANGNAILISSPSWAGAYPWIDKKNHVYGFLLARVSNQKNKFNPFYSSPVLPIMVRDILTNRVKVVSDMKRIILGILIIAPLISTAQYVGQHQGEVSVTTKFPVKAYSFDLQDVQLLDSRFKQNMDREGQWMLSLPVERLLHSFYVNAGMFTDKKSSKTKMPAALGGWEQLDMELRGHSIGHLLSGLSFQYASTSNEVFKKKIDSLVTGLAEVQNTLNEGGYLSAFPQNYIDRNIAGKSVWAPWYTLHKITAGLIDAYWYTGNKQALDVVNKMAAWAYKKLTPLKPEQLALMLRNEFGGMNEAWYNLYSITGNPEHKQLGDMFYHHAVLDPLAQHVDKLNKQHANTIIPKITGEARAYELTGDKQDETIAIYFWDNVLANQTYVTGSNSDKEHFIEPGQISKYITGYTGETCNTYNMLKVTRHLFTWNADVKYADYYERALYNHILGQQDPQTGMVCYFTPLKAGSYRVYSSRDSSFWCCVGSGFESQSKYNEAIYYHDDKGVFVNLFIPSVLNWKEKGLQLRQETNYPEEATTHLLIEKAPSSMVSLYIRYPHWASNGAIVKVNGKAIKIEQTPGSYITVNRKWNSGDKVEITYPMSLRLEPTPDNPKVAAVMYGPIVLAGEMGTENMKKPFHDTSDPYQYYNYDYKIPSDIIHDLKLGSTGIAASLKPVAGKPLTFTTTNTGNGKAITLSPYYDLHRQRYVVYWDLN